VPGRAGDTVELFGTQQQTRDWVRQYYPQCLVYDDDGNETGELQSAYTHQYAIEYFPTLQDVTPSPTDEILMIETHFGNPAIPTGPGVRPRTNIEVGWFGVGPPVR
jgi:hypothetical protein